MRCGVLVPTYNQEDLLLAQLDILSFFPSPHEIIVLYSGKGDLPVPHIRYPETTHGPSGAALSLVYGLREARRLGLDAVVFRNGDDWMFRHDLTQARFKLLDTRPIVGYNWFSRNKFDDLTCNELYIRMDSVHYVDLDAWERRIIDEQPHDPERHVAEMLQVSEARLHRLADREDFRGIGRSHDQDKDWQGPHDTENNRWYCAAWQLLSHHDDRERRKVYQEIRDKIPYAAELEQRQYFAAWLGNRPKEKVSVHFEHGAGDTANFAHMLPLWVKRGYEVEVSCPGDKAPCFEMIPGVRVVKRGKMVHGWGHPPSPPAGWKPSPSDGYAKNKGAWNLTHGGMPDIGHYSSLWDEYKAVKLSLEPLIVDEVRKRVDDFVSTLARPVVLIAPKGNTSPNSKNYPDDKIRELYPALLAKVGGTCVVLDWDNRVPIIEHPNVKHIQKHWMRRIDLQTLWQLMHVSDCLVSIDSGPMHFARFTDIPVVGIWSGHMPSHYVLPRERSVHLVQDRHKDWNEARRTEYNLVEYHGSQPPPEAVAEQVHLVLNTA